MKIEVSKLPYSKEAVFEEVLNFDKEAFLCHLPLIEIKSAKVKAKVSRYDEFIYVNIDVDADLVLQCSYSLKPFSYRLKEKDELHFASFKDDDDEDLILYRGNVIDLDEHIFNLISASIPLSPKAPGAKLPSGGKDYRILSESELKKEREEQGDSRFDKLKDLEFDD